MLLKGDCLTLLPTLPDDSVHAVVTDPPYELGFMGKTWDATGIAYNVEVWRQCLRVLKPGGHLLAFGGSRTYHRLACAIEDAGFEIRDQIMWVYGSGFPKSLDVSKAIDKAAGAERKVIGSRTLYGTAASSNPATGTLDGLSGVGASKQIAITAPTTDEARRWDGWGTALKPAHEPIVLARKPLDGTVAGNVLAHGVGGLNIDATRVPFSEEQIDLSRKQRQQQVERHIKFGASRLVGTERPTYQEGGRWPANFIHDGSDEVLELFPRAKGGAYPAQRGKTVVTSFASGQETEGGPRAMGDDGSAARFFYCAKTSRSERNAGLDHLAPQRHSDRPSDDLPGGDNPRNRTNTPQTNFHPTVKPLALIRYLIQLVTPPGGTILDPFLGSGTTAVAAQQLHHPWIGCEITADYWPIIEGRTKETPPL